MATADFGLPISGSKKQLQSIGTVEHERMSTGAHGSVEGPDVSLSVSRPSPPFIRSSCTTFFLSVLLLIVSTLSLGACDNSFDPFTETETEFFAVFGFLDVEADTQFVRVNPVRPTLADTSRALDAVVATTNLETGQQVIWQDSLVRLDDGNLEHLFYAPMHVQPGVSYRLSVRRSDGMSTEAITTTPPPIPLVTSSVDETTGGAFVQGVTWEGLTSRPFEVTMQYCTQLPMQPDSTVIEIPITQFGMRFGAGWRFEVRLTQDRAVVLRQLGRAQSDETTKLCGLAMEIVLLSDEWRVEGPPLNIDRGFGFFGAKTTHRESWTLAVDEVLRIGYAIP